MDYEAITERQQATWAAGDWNAVAMGVMSASEALVEAVDPRPGARVLDVACGSGNAALVAARRYCEVTGIDYVPEWVDRARTRAAADGVAASFEVGDAQALAFPDASFDVVLSVFGVMFAPDQERAAAELLRVCRPGGVIGLANWMPQGWGIDFFAPHARVAPPPPGLASPLRWGSEEGVRELLEGGAHVTVQRRALFQRFRSPDDALDVFRAHFGPTIRAFEAAGPDGEDDFRTALLEVFDAHNRADDGTARLECEYMQVVAIRR